MGDLALNVRLGRRPQYNALLRRREAATAFVRYGFAAPDDGSLRPYKATEGNRTDLNR
jgi:hypothetical protein